MRKNIMYIIIGAIFGILGLALFIEWQLYVIIRGWLGDLCPLWAVSVHLLIVIKFEHIILDMALIPTSMYPQYGF